jgi:hypothetical protein
MIGLEVREMFEMPRMQPRRKCNMVTGVDDGNAIESGEL